MIIYSPNMLKTYQICPKKFYYQYIEHFSMPKSSLHFEKGKKIHALANYYLQGIKIDRLERVLNTDEKEVWNLLKQNFYFNKDCYKSEFTLSCKINNYWIGGRIDAIVHDNNSDYYILDYKTGTIPQDPHHDYQTMVYLLCVDKFLENYNSLSFIYIDLKNNKNEIIKYNSELKDIYEEKIVSALDLIENDKFCKCKRDNCQFCEYFKICQY